MLQLGRQFTSSVARVGKVLSFGDGSAVPLEIKMERLAIVAGDDGPDEIEDDEEEGEVEGAEGVTEELKKGGGTRKAGGARAGSR